MSDLEEKHNEISAEKDECLGHGSSGFSELEETSPDLLKNTPSNIARLEDVIEHCKNRYKYLTQTRSPSDGEDIRWYFCKVPLAGKGKCINFVASLLNALRFICHEIVCAYKASSQLLTINSDQI